MQKFLCSILAVLCMAPVRVHESETLMGLAHKGAVEATPKATFAPASIMPPALSTNIVRAVPRTNGPVIYRPTPFAPTQSGKLYHLLRSTNLIDWTVVKSDLVGPNSTNGDVFATNRLQKEFWKVLPQDGWSTNVGKARQQPRIGGLRWDLDPSVITK